jgi:hypothetical protein
VSVNLFQVFNRNAHLITSVRENELWLLLLGRREGLCPAAVRKEIRNCGGMMAVLREQAGLV